MLVAALLGVLIAPSFIDWTAYRADFEREASRILGHPVTVRGEASARLLPFPSLTFSDVVVADEANVAKPLMSIAKFRMDAELAPYLSGEIRIFSMRLEEPKLRVPLGSDGRIAFAGERAALPTKAIIVLEDVEVVDGSIAVENGLTGRVHDIDAVKGRFTAKSLTGPFTGTGTLTAGGKPLAFLLSSGPVQPETGLPFKLTVDSRDLDASMVFDGAMNLAGREPKLSGKLQVTSPLPVALPKPAEPFDTAEKAPIRQGAPAAKLLPPFALTSAIDGRPDAVTLTEMRVAAGTGEMPYILTGSGRIGLARLPRFELDLKGEQVDVDKIAVDADAPPEVVTFDQRLEAARAVFAAVPKPTIPGTVKIALPIVVAGDTTIRDVAFTVSPTDTGWSVERFGAELPGRTKMEASGVVTLDPAIGFKGDLLVASRQPSGFAGWLTGTVDPAIRALPQAGFSAKVDLSRETQVFRDLEADVGGDTLRGSLERTGPREDRAMTADFTAGKMDLESLFALSRLFTGEEDTLARADRLALKIGAGPVSYAGATAERIDADLGFDGQKLDIRKLALGNLDGANLTVSGELGDLSGDVAGRLTVALDAQDPERLVEALAQRLPPSPALDALRQRAPTLGPLKLGGEVKTVAEAAGEKPTLQADLKGSAAGTDIALQLALGNGIYAAGTSGRFGLKLALSNETPATLLTQLGLETLPVPAPAPLALQLSLSAGASGPVAASASLRAPGTDLTADGTFDIAATGVTAADFGLNAKSEDLGPWLITTGAAVGQSQLNTLPLDLAGHLAWDGGTIALRNLSGKIAGTDVSAELEKQPEASATGNVFVSDLSLPWLATLVYGRAPEGEDWSKETFASSLLPRLDTVLEVTADRLHLSPGQAVQDFSTTLAGSDGQIQLEDLQGSIAGGYVSGGAVLRNANGIGGFSLQAQLSGIDAGALALAQAGESDDADGAAADGPEAAVAGTIDATVKLDGTGQSYQALVSSLTGAGSVEVSDASFVGIRPGMFGSILKAADAEGFVPGADTASRLVAGLEKGGRYPVPSAKTDFAVTAGVVRFAATTFPGTDEALSGDAALDLKDMSVSGDFRLDMQPGDEAVEGATPSILYRLSGPIAVPALTADVQPLASFLSVRAYEREQARAEAMQEALQERLRLRREARYYRWRETERVEAERAAAVAAAAEELRLSQERAKAEAARVAAAEAAAKAEIARQEEAARQAEVARKAEAARQAAEAKAQAEIARKAELERVAAEKAAVAKAAAAKIAADRAAAAKALADKAAADKAAADRLAAEQRERDRLATERQAADQAEAARAAVTEAAATQAAEERAAAEKAADAAAEAERLAAAKAEEARAAATAEAAAAQEAQEAAAAKAIADARAKEAARAAEAAAADRAPEAARAETAPVRRRMPNPTPPVDIPAPFAMEPPAESQPEFPSLPGVSNPLKF